MRKFITSAAAAAIVSLAFLANGPANANTYNFVYQTEAGYPSYTISGVLTTSNVPNGGIPNGYDISGVTGFMVDPASAVSGISVFAGNATPPGYINNPSWVDYDNSFIPGTGVTSTGGWMFQSTNGFLYNLWLGNGGFGSIAGLVYLYSNDALSAAFSNTPNGPGEPGTFSISQTPLPSTWTMLIAGFLALGFFAHRSAKKSSVAPATA